MTGIYHRHARYLTDIAHDAAIDLGQGDTPLVRSRAIGPRAGLDLWYKMEHLNPTGSYKDRFAGLAIGALVAEDRDACIATSSGNTGAALAAFAAAAGKRCALYVSESAPAGKLEQMLAHGADVFRVRRFSVDAAESARIAATLAEGARSQGLPFFVTAYVVSPGPMEGIKTLAYEIHADLPQVADVFVPVGGGGLFVATCRGFEDLVGDGTRPALPRMHVVQPSGNDTVATPLRDGAAAARDVSTSTTISGLGVGHVLDGDRVIRHARASGGQGHVLSEDRIRDVQADLARTEGILVEPAGAVSVAGALEAAARGEIDGRNPVVCILTGHGFKDPASVAAMGAVPGVRDIDRSGIRDTL